MEETGDRDKADLDYNNIILLYGVEESENQLINSMGKISFTVANKVNMLPNLQQYKANQCD